LTGRTLEQWLAWQAGLNPRSIDLGLARVAQVWAALGAPSPAAKVVTVAGTNGKGSSVAFLEAILREAGFSTGAYTSPHLLQYNERIRINGQALDDASICGAFERIEQVRGDTALTYFEYGTLAALSLFAARSLDVAILEVGLGGRLDAVNVIDADVALITGIGLDHTEWLGDSLEKIGAEKAGVMRQGRPAVFAAPQMPDSIGQVAREKGAQLLRLGKDYSYRRSNESWSWYSAAGGRRNALPFPTMRGEIQLQNAAGVLQVLECLQAALPVDQRALRSGLLTARASARFESYQRRCRWVLDVAHNPQAAQALASQVADLFVAGRTHAVVGMLRDKDMVQVLGLLAPLVDAWHLLDLGHEHRGADANELRQALPEEARGRAHSCDCLETCLDGLDRLTGEQDLVLVFGSFVSVGRVMQWLQAHH
jgi:dihydrofolate synthase/folylpolyglutamate synthase